MKINDRINSRYEIIKELGEGGTAIVYLTFDTITEEYVSVKVLKKEHVDERKLKYFKREALAISLLDNPYIIKFYDFGYDEENDIHYIVQEYVEGMTLKDYIKVSNKLTVKDVADIVIMIMDGLNHAHLKGIIHKDIKSQNILIDMNKNVKITDFGISDIIEDDSTKTQTLMGTPQYVAPETLNRGEINSQTDIYSVGILMYELLCGKTPFKGDKPTVIMMKQLNQPLPSITMQRSEVPQAMENVVIKATAKKLENRYQNAQQMLDDLKHVFDIDNENVERLEFSDDNLSNDEIDATIEFNPYLDKNHKDIESKIAREKKVKRIKIGAIIAAIMLLLSIVLLFNASSNIIMPDIVGKDITSLSYDLEMYGFDADNIKVQMETNDQIEENYIISTDPEAGAEINEETLITIVVSSGPELFTMENYVGQNINDVQGTLEESGLSVKVTTEENEADEGTIISQNFDEGAEIKYDQEIEFVVSSGKNDISLSNFTNLDLDTVKSYANENQLSLSIEYQCHDYYQENHVISQSPSAGSTVTSDDTISIVVSTGACPQETTDDSSDTDDTNSEIDAPVIDIKVIRGLWK